MNTDRKTNIKLISVIRRKAKNDHMSLSELTEKLQNGNKIKSSKISGKSKCEERGNLVTRDISRQAAVKILFFEKSKKKFLLFNF